MSTIKGKKELQIEYDKIADVDIKRIFTKWTEYVRGEAVDLCPVDTGELKQSIHSDVESDGKEATGIVYTSKSYAPYVEFGTGHRGASSADVAPGMDIDYSPDINGQAAQPFLYPALNNNQTRIIRGIKSDLRKAMEG